MAVDASILDTQQLSYRLSTTLNSNSRLRRKLQRNVLSDRDKGIRDSHAQSIDWFFYLGVWLYIFQPTNPGGVVCLESANLLEDNPIELFHRFLSKIY